MPRIARLVFDPSSMPVARLVDLVATAGMTIRSGDLSKAWARFLRLERYSVSFFSAAGGEATWVPSKDGQKRYMFLFVARGILTVTAAEGRYVASKDAIVIAFPGEEPIHVSAQSPVETVAFSFDAGEVQPLSLTPDTVGVLSPGVPVFRACYALLRTLVTTEEPEYKEDTRALLMLLNGTARALLRSARMRKPTLIEAAAEIITVHHTNPELDTESIAARLKVSVSALYKAYSHQASTPAADLRRARFRTARELLAVSPTTPLAQIAQRIGFRSTRTLQRALQTAGVESVDAGAP